MAESFTDKLADRFTFHAVDVARFEGAVHANALALLQRLEGQLQRELERLDPTATLYRRRRLEALQKAVKHNIQSVYSELKRDSRQQLIQMAETVSGGTAQAINKLARVSLLNVGLPRQFFRALADDTLVQGAPAREWWARQAGATFQRFNDQVQEGLYRGETLGQLTGRVIGTKAANFRDGILDKSRREAEGLIRTSVQSVANAARLETLHENPDVIKGYQALAVLDDRTTELCQGRSGFSWYLDGRPMDEATNIEFPGPPPWHFNCRTTLIPITYSWAELAKNKKLGRKVQQAVDKLPPSTQASMDGQVARKLNFEDWLKTKKEAFQKDILGPAKWDIWKKGKLPLRDMIDPKGRPLTLEQLKRRLQGGVPPKPPVAPPAPPAPPPQEPPPPPPIPKTPPKPPKPLPPVPPRQATPPAPRRRPEAPKPPDAPNWDPKTPAGEWHQRTMVHAPQYVQKAVGKLPPPAEVFTDPKGGGSYYNPDTRRLNMERQYVRNPDTAEAQDVWRHEYGHHTDNMLGRRAGGFGYISNTTTWETAWRTDAKDLIARTKSTDKIGLVAERRSLELQQRAQSIEQQEGKEGVERWAREVFSQAGLNYDEFSTMMDEALRFRAPEPIVNKLRMLAAYEYGVPTRELRELLAFGRASMAGAQLMDAMGAVTKNKIGWGHSLRYYNQNQRRQGAEAFANVFAMLGHRNPMWGKMAERFLPRLTTLVKGALENA